VVHPDQLARIAAAGAIASIQPDFHREFGDRYEESPGASRAWRGKSFLDSGVHLAASSDRPVTERPPLSAIGFLANRKTRSGWTLGRDEAISVEQAIGAYSYDAAWNSGLERELGSLTPAKARRSGGIDSMPARRATRRDPGYPRHRDGARGEAHP
jgi:hypothetical protein